MVRRKRIFYQSLLFMLPAILIVVCVDIIPIFQNFYYLLHKSQALYKIYHIYHLLGLILLMLLFLIHYYVDAINRCIDYMEKYECDNIQISNFKCIIGWVSII